ncbi:MAG: rod shape-determining protein MreC [Gammaproteobacteria bacterium]
MIYNFLTEDRNIKKLFAKTSFLGLRATLLVLLAVILLICDRQITYFVYVKSVLRSIVSPVQYVVSWPITFLDTAVSDLASKRALLEENAKLRAEELLLQAKVQKLMDLEQENANLRNLVHSAATKERFLVAQLLAVHSSNFNYEITVDRGKADGVYIGQPVADAYGIIGQVIAVAANSSTILLITDVKSSLPVQILRNGLRAIAIGTGDGTSLELIHIPETMDIKKGDLLVSSDIGSRFPQGYPAGVVNRVEKVPGERFLRVLMLPSARINQSRQMLLIWSEQASKSEPAPATKATGKSKLRRK